MKRNVLVLMSVVSAAVGSVNAQGLPDGEGRATYENVCGACHGADIVIGSKGSRTRWEEVVDSMKNRGASGSDADFAAVVDYLTKNFGTEPAKPAAPAKPAPAKPAAAAKPAPGPALYKSAADVAALIATARADRKDQATMTANILRSTPYQASLEYRAAVGPAAVHDTEAEMFYVIEGSATMVTGGKLVGETRLNAENTTGSAIEGGTARTIGKGDFIMVPEKTAHWFSRIEGTLVLMSIHLPIK
jgi:mannose-6-phosphate isomerase-like protein (cupin superfamily)